MPGDAQEVLKKFKMDQAKKWFLPVLQGVKLSKTQCPTTVEDRDKMKVEGVLD